ncbi:MAG: hypothetical protein R3E31_02520 [Chloroflexota bacterium]
MNETTRLAAPPRVRIASHLTQSRFLHVEDTLQLGKVRLFAGVYTRGAGISMHTAHFCDEADARVIFTALAEGRDGLQYKEYKGTPGKSGGVAESRVLSVAVKGENIYIELKAGPGKETPTGAIMPAGAARVVVNVTFKRHEAARLALTVLAYLHAWDVVRMMAQRQVVSKIWPYTLVPTEGTRSAEREMRSELVEGVRERRDSSIPHAALAKSHSPTSRPITRKGTTPGNGVAGQRVNGNGRAQALTMPPPTETAVSKQPLVPSSPAPETPPVPPAPTPTYGNGSRVDAHNLTEMETFAQYMEEKKAVPESKSVLLAYYQLRVQQRLRLQAGS